MTHLLVAVDKFTKWIKARPIKKLDGRTAVRFIKDITVRYGMPNNIITDNGTNFAKGALEQYYSVSGPPRPGLRCASAVQRAGQAGQWTHPVRRQAVTRRATHPLTRQLA